MNTTSTTIENTFDINTDEVIEICEILPHRIKGIYVFGDRVYGIENQEINPSIMVVANCLYDYKEMFGEKYDIYIKVSTRFRDSVMDCDMVALECMYAPENARLKEDYAYMYSLWNNVRTPMIKKGIDLQSRHMWSQARHFIEGMDLYRGKRTLWHSLKALMFGIQICENGSIKDFTEANRYWYEIEQMDADGDLNWEAVKSNFFPLKVGLEKLLKDA